MAGPALHIKRPWQVLRVAWARIVSDVLSPPVVWFLAIIAVANQHLLSFADALQWSLLYGLLICVIPVAYIAWLVHRREIGDLHMQHRHERYKPLALSVVMAALAILLLKLWVAPPIIVLLAVLGLVQISVIAVVTLTWQISVHAMTITSAVMAVGLLVALPLGLLLTPSIALVGAARLHLQRHTSAQIVAGAMVGLLVPLVVLGTLAGPLVSILAF